MKKFILIIVSLILAIGADAQIKKPRLVVIPSDNLLKKMGCLEESSDQGQTVYIPNYKKALLDDDLRACITKINERFNDQGFPLTDLDQQLARIQNKKTAIPVDIRLELNYKIEQRGPRKSVYFELLAFDQYSSKQIGGTSGNDGGNVGVSLENQLQASVLSQFEKFAGDIQNYFDKMAKSGRESRLTVLSKCEVHVDKAISKLVENWLAENCINGNFSTDQVTEEEIDVSQAMMPLEVGGRGLAATDFYNSLKDEINALVRTKNYEANFDRSSLHSGSRGGTLGDAVIVISEASGDDDF